MKEEIATVQKFYDVIVEFFVQYSFQILGAIIILLVGFKLAAWVAALVVRFCEQKKLDVTLTGFLGSLTRIIILVFVSIIALGKFGISMAPFIAAISAIAFGSSFAIAGPLSNYGAGLSIILSRHFIVGNTITVKGYSGVVEEVHLAVTILSTEDGEKITIPNKQIVGEILQNSFENKVVEASVGISYEDDPEKAIQAVQAVLKKIENVCGNPPPQVGIVGFGESSIDIAYRYWVPTKKYFQTLYKVNMAVHQSLKEKEITIPFPQRDVHVVGEFSGSEK